MPRNNENSLVLPDQEEVERIIANVKARRKTLTQSNFGPQYQQFEEAIFPGFVRELKIMRNGGMLVPIEVSYRHLSRCQELMYVNGVPLIFQVQKLKRSVVDDWEDGDGED